MKNVTFVPKDVQRILSSHKISENYNEHKVSYKKTVLKEFAIFTGKHLCWSLFFNKSAGLQACNFIKKRLQHRCYLDNTATFLRTAILKSIFERLLLSVFPFMLVRAFSYMNKYQNKLHRKWRRRFLKNKIKILF